MNKSSNKIISYILTLAIVFCSICLCPLTTQGGEVYAASTRDYLYDLNSCPSIANVFGSGEWDNVTRTLTLSGISYSSTGAFEKDTVIGVRVPSGSSIVIEGNNSISIENTSGGSLCGIFCAGNITITGTGVLNLMVSSGGIATCVQQTGGTNLSIGCAVSMNAISLPGSAIAVQAASNINIADNLISSGGLFVLSNKITFASAGTPFTLSWPAPSPAPTPTPSPSPTPSPDPTPSPVAYSTPTDVYYPEYFIFTPKATGGSININLYRRFNEVGSRVKFGYEAQEGYELLEIKAVTVSGKDIPITILSDSTAQLIMPGEDVYVTPLFKKTAS